MRKSVLVEGHEGSRVREVRRVWVEGEGVEGPAMILGTFNVAQMVCSRFGFQRLEGLLPLVLGDVEFGTCGEQQSQP